MILISDGQQNLHVQEGDWKETRVDQWQILPTQSPGTPSLPYKSNKCFLEDHFIDFFSRTDFFFF